MSRVFFSALWPFNGTSAQSLPALPFLGRHWAVGRDLAAAHVKSGLGKQEYRWETRWRRGVSFERAVGRAWMDGIVWELWALPREPV